jgi:predicted nucleic acid-binding protein
LEPVARCFDSNILIDAINGVAAARLELEGDPEDVISVITWIEVLVGCKTAAEEDVARSLLATFEVVELDGAVAEETARLRRELGLKLPDAAVLATARLRGLILVTRNTRDFSPTDPTIRIPYEL